MAAWICSLSAGAWVGGGPRELRTSLASQPSLNVETACLNTVMMTMMTMMKMMMMMMI